MYLLLVLLFLLKVEAQRLEHDHPAIKWSWDMKPGCMILGPTLSLRHPAGITGVVYGRRQSALVLWEYTHKLQGSLYTIAQKA